MNHWTDEQLQAYLAKNKKLEVTETIEPDPGLESVLQRKINKWAHSWGHPILSLKQSKGAKALLPSGWPDIVLILHSNVIFIELKAANGRISDDQKMMKLQFMSHGFTIHEVRSFRQFLTIVEENI
jgi:hypothetical protein